MLPSELLNIHRDKIAEIFQNYPNLCNLRVFGSVARGEDTEESDIDLIVDQASDASIYDIGRLHNELETLLGVSVDLLMSHDRSNDVFKKVLKRDARELFTNKKIAHGDNTMSDSNLQDAILHKLLNDIFNSSGRILGRIDDILKDEFIHGKNNDIQDIVARHFTVIGEASASILKRYKEFCNEHPEIPLQEARSLRNVIVHEYDDINWQKVWNAAKYDLPKLWDAVGKILHQKQEEQRSQQPAIQRQKP
ncbi:MAG: DUF86 domain-containing protein [Desulfovibrio sp.]|jgi:uncharacterized protein with HEPN domain/predicted nucleotidyltransferase|nr:DUF86 domain-containing protein [Desulfovibrio sp.]